MGNQSNIDMAATAAPHVETLYYGRCAAEISIPAEAKPGDALYHGRVLAQSAAEMTRCVGEASDRDLEGTLSAPEEIRYALAGVEVLIRLSLIYQNCAAERAEAERERQS